jgi:hypothetical protein
MGCWDFPVALRFFGNEFQPVIRDAPAGIAEKQTAARFGNRAAVTLNM